MTVADLLGRLTSHEIAEWRAWFELEAKERSHRAEEARLEARATERVKAPAGRLR